MAKCIRILLYEGTPKWIHNTLMQSCISEDKPLSVGLPNNPTIVKEVFRGVYPDGENPPRITIEEEDVFQYD